MIKKITIILLVAALYAAGSMWMFRQSKTSDAEIRFSFHTDETLTQFADRLHEDGIIRQPHIFLLYIRLSGADRNAQAGDFVLAKPFTIARIAEILSRPGTAEKEITIIPGWTLRDIAAYLVKEGIAKNEDEVYAQTGHPATIGDEAAPRLYGLGDYPFLLSKPTRVSLEGYLRPDTYRIYKSATLDDVLRRLLSERAQQIPDTWYADAKQQGKTMHEIFTMASMLQKEVRGSEDKKMVADIF